MLQLKNADEWSAECGVWGVGAREWPAGGAGSRAGGMRLCASTSVLGRCWWGRDAGAGRGVRFPRGARGARTGACVQDVMGEDGRRAMRCAVCSAQRAACSVKRKGESGGALVRGREGWGIRVRRACSP